MKNKVKILLLSASCSDPSHTEENTRVVGELLPKYGAEVYVWNILKRPLPTPNPLYHSDPLMSDHEVVKELASLADDADGFVWATPVYHNSFSGILKICLDNLAIKQFRHKPVALISHGPDRSGVQPCDQMRIIVRGFLGVAIPTQAVTISDDFEFKGNRYCLKNQMIFQRFTRMAKELTQYAMALREVER